MMRQNSSYLLLVILLAIIYTNHNHNNNVCLKTNDTFTIHLLLSVTKKIDFILFF